ncbi:hypothetical protein C8A05DRAFT_20213 [Staphylotrichum tortipilum]|uniref:F-box domain-containing protein n=1 Tax=Staphylotrichum tortipilum TaxID=2831512 RepID=A0AAN6M9X9_9PEZI|nr:hypothetical protein C8A05DRAFT_20213 [Staphylotrichum longicolle]
MRALLAKISLWRTRKPRPLTKLEAVQHVAEATAATAKPDDDSGNPRRPASPPPRVEDGEAGGNRSLGFSAQPSPTVHPPRIFPPTLETLPAELRIQILSHLANLKDLMAAVHASPVLYQQYLLDRQRFLEQALRRELPGTMLADAYAVQATTIFSTTRKYLEIHRMDQAITRVINEYVELRSDPNTVAGHCNLEDLINMASFYLGVVQPLLLEFPHRMLSKLEGGPEPGALSETERTRFLRALYRFQVFQNLFGAGKLGSRFHHADILAEFFCMFRPWEIEEINCINQLVRTTYDAVLYEIVWDVNKDNPKFGERFNPMTPPGAFDLETACNSFLGPARAPLSDVDKRELLLDGIVGRGLVLFHTVSRTLDHEDLVTVMQRNLGWYLAESIDYFLNWTIQDRRRSQQPTEDDRREADWESLPFSGDKEDGPPLAWVIIWRGTFSNTYGEVISSAVRDWGYILWDSRRLVRSGGKRELQKAWEDSWHGGDTSSGGLMAVMAVLSSFWYINLL